MTCIIIEDQSPAQRILQNYIANDSRLELLGVFADTTEAISILESGTVDLMFLDIHLPTISGIDFLKRRNFNTSIVITTAFQDYALTSYEFDVLDYLLKPFSFDRFKQAVDKVLRYSQQDYDDSHGLVYIKSGHTHHKVRTKDILYIKAAGDYTEVKTGSNTILANESLKHWELELMNYDFRRIHKSYIINLSRITKVSTNQVSLIGNHIIPVGRSYKQSFGDYF